MVLSTLSLRIYGGSLSTGFNTQALVSAGAAPEGFRPTPPTIVDEQRSWMITHAQAYTAYSLYHRSYPAADGKPGQMLLVLFLPPQLRLAEGKSPLALLDTLHDLFVVQAMADDRLPAEPIDSTAFQNLLRRYKLEERPTLLPIMTGSEPASFCADNITQIEALMRYSRYTELSNVGRLEVGLHCATTVQLPIKGKPQAQSTAKPTAQPVDQPTESEQTVSDKQADIKQEETTPNPERSKTQAETQRTVQTTITETTEENTTYDSATLQEENHSKKKILMSVFMILVAIFVALLIPIVGTGGVNRLVANLTHQWYLSGITRILITIFMTFVTYGIVYGLFLKRTLLRSSKVFNIICFILTFLWSAIMGIVYIPD